MRFLTLSLVLLCSLVTAQEDARLLRVYDIGPLVPRGTLLPEDSSPHMAPFSLVGPITGMPSEEWWGSFDKTVKPVIIGRAVAELAEPFAQSIEVSESGEHLLVTGTLEQHKQVARMMEALQRDGDFEIEVRHIALNTISIDPKVRRLLDDAMAGKLVEAGLKQLEAIDRNTGKRKGTLLAPEGRWTVFRAERELRYVPNYAVEIAQAAAIADPVPAVATAGVKAAVRPFLLRSGRVLLRVVASAGDLGDLSEFEPHSSERTDTLRLRNTDYGMIEQADYRGCALSTEMVLAPGRTKGLVVSTPGSRTELLLFTLKRAPEPARAGTFMVLRTGALTDSDALFLVALSQNGEPIFRVPSRYRRMDLGGLQDRLWAAMGGDDAGVVHDASWSDGGLLVLHAKAPTVVPALDTLGALERAFLGPVRLSVRLMVGSNVVGLVGGPMVASRPSSFAGYRRIDYIGDYDVEIAQESRIADPNPMAAVAGVIANARVHRAGAGRYRLRLDLRVSAMPEGVRTIDHRTGGVGVVQSVPMQVVETLVRTELAAGREKRIELGANPFGGGSLVAVIAVHDRE